MITGCHSSTFSNWEMPSLLAGQVLSALFYAMLILGTFLLGSLRNKKTGIIAALFVAFNPMIFLFSDHIMTDIPVAALATFSMYFFIKSYGKETINKKALLIAIIFSGLTLFTKPTGLFILPLISIYALNKQISQKCKASCSSTHSSSHFFRNFCNKLRASTTISSFSSDLATVC